MSVIDDQVRALGRRERRRGRHTGRHGHERAVTAPAAVSPDRGAMLAKARRARYVAIQEQMAAIRDLVCQPERAAAFRARLDRLEAGAPVLVHGWAAGGRSAVMDGDGQLRPVTRDERGRWRYEDGEAVGGEVVGG